MKEFLKGLEYKYIVDDFDDLDIHDISKVLNRIKEIKEELIDFEIVYQDFINENFNS